MGAANAADVRAMTKTLGAYGPVMLAHYTPGNGSRAAAEADVRAVLDDAYLDAVARSGLFALSFMDDHAVTVSDRVHQLVKRAVWRYGTGGRR